MRILVVSAVYPPEPITAGRNTAQLVEALADGGHQVQVVAPYPNRPGGRLYPGYRRRLFEDSRSDQGVPLRYCWTIFSRRSSLPSRFLENVSFGLAAAWAILRLERPQALYVMSWPVLAPALAALAARWRRVPFVVNIQDVYPESLVVQGRAGKDSLLVRWLGRLDRWVAHSSQAVVVISESFARVYRQERGVAAEKVIVVPNWADERLLEDPQADAQAQSLRQAQAIPPEARLVVYAGNIGTAAGVEGVIQAFAALRDCEQVWLLAAGEGASLAACQALADRLDLRRVRFHSPWPVGETAAVLRAADILLLPTQGEQSLVSVPSKLMYYMLAGRPVLAQVLEESDSAQAILRAGCGWLAPPGRPELLAARIAEAASLPRAELEQLGRQGQEYARRSFTRQACLPRLAALLEGLSGD